VYYSNSLISDTGYDLRVVPLYFLYGGQVTKPGLSNAGADGRYWCSTSFDESNAYRLTFYHRDLFPVNGNIRYYGFSIRCLAR